MAQRPSHTPLFRQDTNPWPSQGGAGSVSQQQNTSNTSSNPNQSREGLLPPMAPGGGPGSATSQDGSGLGRSKHLPGPAATPGDGSTPASLQTGQKRRTPTSGRYSPHHQQQDESPRPAESAPHAVPLPTDWVQLNASVKHHNYTRSIGHLAIHSSVLSDENWIWLCRIVPLLDVLVVLDLSNTAMTDERCKMLIGDVASTAVGRRRNMGSAGAGSPLFGLLRNHSMQLKTIDWSHNELSSKCAASMGKLIRHYWHSLVFLNIRSNKLDDHAVQIIGTHISSLFDIACQVGEGTSLRSVDVSCNRISARGLAELLVHSSTSQSVTNLILTDNAKTRPQQLHAMDGSPIASPNARSPSALSVGGMSSHSLGSSVALYGGGGGHTNRVVPYIPRDLLHSMVCPNGLRTIDLSQCHIGPENGVELIRVVLYSCTTLSELYLSGNGLDDAIGLEFVDTVRVLEFMTVLDLSGNQAMTGETVKLLCHAIVALGKMPHLQLLKMAHCDLNLQDVMSLVQLAVPGEPEAEGERQPQDADAEGEGVKGACALPSLDCLDVTYTQLNTVECNMLHQALRDSCGCTVRFGPPNDGTSKKIITQHSPPSRSTQRRQKPAVSPTPFQMDVDKTVTDVPQDEDHRSREITEELIIELSLGEEASRRAADDEELPPPEEEEKTDVQPSLDCSPIKEEAPTTVVEEEPELEIAVQEPTVVLEEDNNDAAKDEQDKKDRAAIEDDQEPPARAQILDDEAGEWVDIALRQKTEAEKIAADAAAAAAKAEEEAKADEAPKSAKDRLRERRAAQKAGGRKKRFSYLWDHSAGHVICRVLHLFGPLGEGPRAQDLVEALEEDIDRILHDGKVEDGQVGNIQEGDKKRTTVDLSNITLASIVSETVETPSKLRERLRVATNDEFIKLNALLATEGGDALYCQLKDRYTALQDYVALECLEQTLHDSHGREEEIMASLPPPPKPEEEEEEEEEHPDPENVTVLVEPPQEISIQSSSSSSSSDNDTSVNQVVSAIIIEPDDVTWTLPMIDHANPQAGCPRYAPSVWQVNSGTRALDDGDVKFGQMVPVPPVSVEAGLASQNAKDRSLAANTNSIAIDVAGAGGAADVMGGVGTGGDEADAPLATPGWLQAIQEKENPSSQEDRLDAYRSMLADIASVGSAQSSRRTSAANTPRASSMHNIEEALGEGSATGSSVHSLRSPSVMLDPNSGPNNKKKPPPSTKPKVAPEKLVPFSATVEERRKAFNAPTSDSANNRTASNSPGSAMDSVAKRRQVATVQRRQTELRKAFTHARDWVKKGKVDLPEQNRNKIRICQGEMGRLDVTVSVEWNDFLVIKNKVGIGAKDVVLIHPLKAVSPDPDKPLASAAPGKNLILTLVKPRHLVENAKDLDKDEDSSKVRRRIAFSQTETAVFQITLDKQEEVRKAIEKLNSTVALVHAEPGVGPRTAMAPPPATRPPAASAAPPLGSRMPPSGPSSRSSSAAAVAGGGNAGGGVAAPHSAEAIDRTPPTHAHLGGVVSGVTAPPTTAGSQEQPVGSPAVGEVVDFGDQLGGDQHLPPRAPSEVYGQNAANYT